MEIYSLDEMPNLFSDAYVADNNDRLLFLSLWGQDTTLQELLARLSLPIRDGGLATLTLQGRRLQLPNVEQLQKHTGRTAKDALFPGLSQLWLYDNLAIDLDRSNKRALLLYKNHYTSAVIADKLWQIVRELCHVPLLPQWHSVLEHFSKHDWLQFFQGHKINAVRIDLSSEEVETLISELIQARILSLVTLSKEPNIHLPSKLMH